jgi:SAM-dependent methyltransferase
MSGEYAYDHGWRQERTRLAGLEAALDPGTIALLLRFDVGPGSRCLEVGAGGGSIALWLAERVAPDGVVLATDVETDFLESVAADVPNLEVLRHDLTTEELPTAFDLVHARWTVEWLPDKRHALRQMTAALRPGGVLLDEEPVFATMFNAAEPRVLRRVVRALIEQLESSGPVECSYGRRLLDDLAAVGLIDVTAEGRSAVVRGGAPPAVDFFRLSIEKLRPALLENHAVTDAELTQAITALEDPAVTVIMPVTVAAWGYRP